jgi:hypothetical protein
VRKSEIVVGTIGRDATKHFLITEAPAMKAEKWAWRLFIAVKGTSGEVPAASAAFGMVEVARRGINAFLASDVSFEKLEPLLDELFDCVRLVRDISVIDQMTGKPVATPIVGEDDIAEPATIAWLRSEVLRVHTNFSLVASALSWIASLTSPKPPEDSPNT